MEKRFYNAREIAIYLGLSEETVRKWVQRGEIPSSKLGRAVRFDLVKINTWLKTKECYDNI